MIDAVEEQKRLVADTYSRLVSLYDDCPYFALEHFVRPASIGFEYLAKKSG